MNKIILLFVLWISCNSFGQNLIQNGSFEDFSTCYPAWTNGIDQFDSVDFWINPAMMPYPDGGTPDFFTTCNPLTTWIVPNAYWGYEVPHTGDSYVCIATTGYLDTSTTNYREYIENPLLQSLNPGEKYYLELYVSLPNKVKYGCHNLQAYFSNSIIDTISNYNLLPFLPQVNLTGSIPDSSGWTKFEAEYTALGGETYIIIGNFLNDANSTIYMVNPTGFIGQATAVYIDDVSLTSEFNELPTLNPDDLSIFPNPTSGEVSIIGLNLENEFILISVLDFLGREVATFQGSETIDLTALKSGLYTLKITSQNNGTIVRTVRKN